VNEVARHTLLAYRDHCHTMLVRVLGILANNQDLSDADLNTLKLCEDRWRLRLLSCKTLLGMHNMSVRWRGEKL
jgi:isopenicillin N synthase-like dioxygenase